MKRILVTGAGGQVGSELVPALRSRCGADAVIASDVRPLPSSGEESGRSHVLDCTDAAAVERVIKGERIDTVYHLVAILSAVAEESPTRAYAVNMGSLLNVLESARAHRCAVFVPSSIAGFGPGTPPVAPQDTLQRPNTMYGVTKVAGELLCDYYHQRFGVDVRGVRYPGLISYLAPPGGGTTDYAVEIFHAALHEGAYTCFLAPDTQLDMMYMPDAIRAAIELMQTDPARLIHRNAFNVTAMQFTPARLAQEIGKHLPEFTISYEVDPLRQSIAESWPRRLDDSAARAEWGWRPEFDIESMTTHMLANLGSGRNPGSRFASSR